MIDGGLNFVHWLGKKAVIRDEEIEALKDFVVRHQNIQIEKLEYEPGTVIELESGPFKGKGGNHSGGKRKAGGAGAERVGNEVGGDSIDLP